jgi:hypothetical protein
MLVRYWNGLLSWGRFEVRVPVGARDFSPFQNVQTGSGAHPPSYSSSKWGSFLGVNRPGRDVGHWSLPSAKAKSDWSHTSAPHICVRGANRVHSTLLLLYRVWYRVDRQVPGPNRNRNSANTKSTCTFYWPNTHHPMCTRSKNIDRSNEIRL